MASKTVTAKNMGLIGSMRSDSWKIARGYPASTAITAIDQDRRELSERRQFWQTRLVALECVRAIPRQRTTVTRTSNPRSVLTYCKSLKQRHGSVKWDGHCMPTAGSNARPSRCASG